MRFTQPVDFNDPFECSPKFQLMSKEEQEALPRPLDEEGEPIPGQRQLTPEALARMLRIAESSIERLVNMPTQPGAMYLLDNDALGRDYYNQRFGIFSLTETHDNLLMWSHYADNHKGVVIGFDETHACFNGPEIASNAPRLNRVEYNSKRPVLSPTTINTPQVFVRKSPEWSYEREWRVIRPLDEAIEVKPGEGAAPICLFDIPVEAIKMVITGAMMRQEERAAIRSYCSSTEDTKHISLHQMLLSKEHYKLETVPGLTEEERGREGAGKALSAKPFAV